MLRINLESRLLQTLTRHADTRGFPIMVGGFAFLATVSMTVPFASVLVASVLLAAGRWRSIASWSSAGAAVGAMVLYLVFHHLGWTRVFDAYPELVRSTAWVDATRWLTQYGVGSLFVISVLPVPLTPALVFAAISRLPVIEVVAALWAGKWLKYWAYAWLASRSPERLLHRGQQHIDVLRTLLATAGVHSQSGTFVEERKPHTDAASSDKNRPQH
jgi:membrane protein YqaA with SNARE-associated domain